MMQPIPIICTFVNFSLNHIVPTAATSMTPSHAQIAYPTPMFIPYWRLAAKK